MSKYLNIKLSDGVLSVEINRPQVRNALSGDTLADIRSVFSDYAADRGIKLAVLRGSGDKSFAAGGDLRELSELRAHEQAVAMSEAGRAALDSIRYFPAPVLAAVNGDALGGGAELALACDMRLLAGHARIAYVQGRINISPGWGGGYDLLRKVGPRGIAMLCSKQWFTAQEALFNGLADYVATTEESLEDALSRVLAPMLEQSAHVMRSYKQTAISVWQGHSRDAVVAEETALFADHWVHDDHWTAVDKLFSKA